MRAAVSRADMLRAYLEQGKAASDDLARRLGYRRSPSEGRPASERSVISEIYSMGEATTPTTVSEVWAPVPLWRVVRRHWEDLPDDRSEAAETEDDADGSDPGGSDSDDDPRAKSAREGLRPQDLVGSGEPPPPIPPIAPWPVLRRALDDCLRTPRPRRALDVDALVALWARGRNIEQLPRLEGVTHARLALIVDDSPRLAPFRHDVLGLVALFVRRLDPHMLRFLPSPSGLVQPTYPTIANDEIVLALSDLGHYGSAEARANWLRLGRRLRRRGDRLIALVPVPGHRQERALAKLWSAIDWSAPQAGRRQQPAEEPKPVQGAELLLTAIAPALRVEPGLLRAIRRRLGPSVDLGCEVEVWNHAQVRGSASSAICIDLKTAPAWQQRFAQLSADIRQAVAETVVRWHRHLPFPIRWAEVLQFREAGVDLEGLDPDLADAAAFLERAAQTLDTHEPEDSPLGQQVDAFWQRFRRRASSPMFHASDLRHTLERVEDILRRRYPDLDLPSGSTPTMLGSDRPPQSWTLWQEGKELRARPLGAAGRGSPVVDLMAACVRLEDGRNPVIEIDLDGDAVASWPTVDAFRIVTEAEVVEVVQLPRPTWSKAAGRDRFGLWADLEIEGIVQRMRWISPGRFMMGSPEDEAGRYDDEGPQHEVILTEGFWLADTPCTQEMWQAVMGSNPSRFASSKRPVENVSWDDCQEFVERLAGEGLGARLPTEAQWEFACRGGTSTATWFGDLEIRGKRNAPLLDEIAWYGGNSGHNFDLESGWNSSSWLEKQYEHRVAGSRDVKLKMANPWGLYDMLGNVEEWCDDGKASYEIGSRVDPKGPEKGLYRVLRGGSWYVNASNARAACRYWYLPESCLDFLGFRLALVEVLGRGVVEGSGPWSEFSFLEEEIEKAFTSIQNI